MSQNDALYRPIALCNEGRIMGLRWLDESIYWEGERLVVSGIARPDLYVDRAGNVLIDPASSRDTWFGAQINAVEGEGPDGG